MGKDMGKIRLDLLSGDDFLIIKQASELATLLKVNADRIEFSNKQFVAGVVNALIADAKNNYEANLSQAQEANNENQG